jgi:hypothetical protein
MSKRKNKSYEKHKLVSFEMLRKTSPFILVIFILFIVSGGIYEVINHPPSLVGDQSGGATSIYLGASEQTSSEFVLSFLLYGMTFVGIILIYRGSRIYYDKQSANTQVALGIILSASGFLILLLLYRIKVPVA